jgi:hypothetical protein
MNDFEIWANELSDFLETTARRTEAWAEQTLQTFVDSADTLADEIEKQMRPTLEQWADDLQETVEPVETVIDEEVERFSEDLSEFITPIVVPLASALESWLEAMAAPVSRHVDPVFNEHTTCIGCKHYYGQAHGGHMMVCAMYPYGPEAEECPDWESVWGQQSDSNE